MTQHDDESRDGRPIVPPGRKRAPRSREIDPDLMSPDELHHLEEMTDGLLDLIGHHQRRFPESPAFDDPRFLDWLSREYADDEDPELLTPDEIGTLARRIASGSEIERLGLRAVDGTPERRGVEHPGAVSRLLQEVSAAHGAALLGLSVAAGVGHELWDIECDSWIPLPDDVPPGRYLALTIAGDSMTPVLREGDLALVSVGTDAAAAVAVDTIVVARLPDDGYVVKRVGRVTQRWIELTSLNPAYPPIRLPRGPGAVLGTVVLRWRADDV